MDLHKLDPDWDFAQRHGRANSAGIPRPSSSQNPTQLCPCCYQQIDKQPVPLWQNSKQLQFLGFGYPLFYQFLKNCIILLVLSICSYNALALQQALTSNYSLCHEKGSNQTNHRLLADSTTIVNETIRVGSHGLCHTYLVEIARIQDFVTPHQEGMRIVSFVLHLLALIYIRNRILKLEDYYDQRNTTMSDYSLIFKGFPLVKGIQTKLRDFLSKQFKNKHQIKQITLLPEYPEIQKLEQQKKSAINQLRPFYQQNQSPQQNLQFKQKLANLAHIQKQITRNALCSKQLALADQLLCQKIICVFNTQPEKQQVLQQFYEIPLERKQLYFGQGAKKIYVKEAPEPQEIIWENANLSRKKRVLYILLGWGLSLLVLVVVFIVFFLILQKKSLLLEEATAELDKHPDDEKYQVQYRGALALVFILMFLVVIFDKIVMSTLYHKFTDLERHSTTSKFQFSFALKLTLGLFFTTALMTLAVQAIRFHNYYLHAFGVIDQQSIMFFMNSFFVPFFWLIHPTRIFKQIKRKFKYGKRSMTQFEANQLMEQQNYDMGKRFAQIIQMMWFTFLYSTLIPIGAVLTCFGLIFYYWVDKYNLLRRSSVNGQISGQVINTSINLLDVTLLLRPIGAIIFDSQIRQFYMNSNIIMIVIAAVYILIPKIRLISLINHEKFHPEEQTYQQAKQHIHRTYHTQHPVYRIIHEARLRKRMLSRGMSFQGSFGQIDENTDLNAKASGNSNQVANLNRVKREDTGGNLESDFEISNLSHNKLKSCTEIQLMVRK